MSDVTGQYPPGAPTPPSQPAPPPPPPPPGLFPESPAPQPADQQPPANRSGRGWIIGGVIALVLLCALVSCATVGAIAFSGGGDKAAVRQAEKHLSAAMSAVSSATASIESANTGNSAVVVISAQKSVQQAHDELIAAKVAAEQIKDEQARTDYLGALDAGSQAVDGLGALVAYMGTANGMAKQLQSAASVGSKAGDDLNAAIQAGNAGNYGKMKMKAKAATSEFARAEALFSAANRLDKTAGLVQAVAYAKKRRAQAALLLKMASEGSAGSISAYNRNVGKMNALGRQAAAIHAPAIVDDPNWVTKRLSVIEKEITDAADKADLLRAKALKEIGLATGQ